jgi:hypothetical protein
MFILFGTRGRWSRKSESGQFACPSCGGDRAWVRSVLRRWFTLFFIPLFPFGKTVAEAVQCTTCNKRFDRDVLIRPTTETMTAELQGSMRLATTEVVRAAGGGHAAAVAAVRAAGMLSYDEAAQAHDAEHLATDGLGAHLQYLAAALSLPGREQFLSTVTGVARAAGALDAARPTLEDIGRRLDLSPAHVAGVLGMPTSTPPPAPTPWSAPEQPPA